MVTWNYIAIIWQRIVTMNQYAILVQCERTTHLNQPFFSTACVWAAPAYPHLFLYAHHNLNGRAHHNNQINVGGCVTYIYTFLRISLSMCVFMWQFSASVHRRRRRHSVASSSSVLSSTKAAFSIATKDFKRTQPTKTNR